ncbi:TIGR03747 family integrating conjugative element membrane protein [Pseudomonas helleri]|uniref:TIGR03747 family integrating conjugative element membrane protein n=1 Tax=Pseudomonas helleri TaxID=1608996 RepID=A0A7X1XAK7_9PSED|nr:TIGR03747 family integrating conjugative element membrane protein [Pseudomonas helleri]MQT88015.1 TIGR03747 family integrating conjugative element membrane protein [Pseudomonas helleri]
MSTTAPSQPPAQRHPGLIFGTVELCLGLLGLLFAALVFSIVLEFAGMLWFWPEQGWHHSHAMWQTELGWLSSHFKSSLLVQEPAQATATILEHLNDWVVVRSGWAQFDTQLKLLSREASLQGQFAQAYVVLQDYLLAALFTVFTFVVRLAVLTLATPLFLLAVITGAVDGLMRRDLRKFGAGRESSFVYHRAKRTLPSLMVSPRVIYRLFAFKGVEKI